MRNINDSRRDFLISNQIERGTKAWREYLDNLGFSGGSLVGDTKALMIARNCWDGIYSSSFLNFFLYEIVPIPNKRPTIVVVAMNFESDGGPLVGDTAGNYTTDGKGDGDVLTVTFNTTSTHYTLNTGASRVELTQAGVDEIELGGPVDAIDLKVTDDGEPPLSSTDSDTPIITTPVQNQTPTIDVMASDFTELEGASVGDLAATYVTDDKGEGDVLTVTFNTPTTHYTLNVPSSTVLLTQVAVNLIAIGSPIDSINLRVTDDGEPPLSSMGSDTPVVTPAPPLTGEFIWSDTFLWS